MTKEPLSAFHRELLDYLKREVTLREKEEGFSPKEDPEYQAFSQSLHNALSPHSTDKMIPLEEILENYQYLFETRGPIQIEKKLLEMFSSQEFAHLKLSKYFPKIYRGLPRLYRKDKIFESHIKKNFTHLPSLIAQVAENVIVEEYAAKPLRGGKVVLFTYVIADGLGDFHLGLKTFKALASQLPELSLEWVVLIPKTLKRTFLRKEAKGLKNISFFSYNKEPFLEAKALYVFQKADVVLQIPTYYPGTEALQQELGKTPFLSVGEYGFLESSWFHPKTKNRSMGLHFLEKGIFFEEPKKDLSLLDLENRFLLELLLGKKNPRPKDVANYFAKRHLYFAYVSTFSGGYVYLHALLKCLEKDKKPIDICLPDFSFFVKILEEREGKSLFESDFGINAIEFFFGREKRVLQLGQKGGKKIRVFSTGALSSQDFEILMAKSGSFVAVRGNQSFSEALSYEKVFFYDGREHSRYFFKDLLALVTNRLGQYPNAVRCFQAMAKAFLHTLPEESGLWVDETYFQEKEPLLAIALELGKALLAEDTKEGFKKLSSIIKEEYSFVSYLTAFLKRAFYQKAHPEVAILEEKLLGAFIEKKCTFTNVITKLREKLHDRDQ